METMRRKAIRVVGPRSFPQTCQDQDKNLCADRGWNGTCEAVAEDFSKTSSEKNSLSVRTDESGKAGPAVRAIGRGGHGIEGIGGERREKGEAGLSSGQSTFRGTQAGAEGKLRRRSGAFHANFKGGGSFEANTGVLR